MHPEADDLVSAVVVTPTTGGTHAEVTNLREPYDTYTAPLPSADSVSISVVGSSANGNDAADQPDHRRN